MKNLTPVTSETHFQNLLPDEVIAALPEEIRVQYFFWDRLNKRQIGLHPHLVLPLVSETFHKDYSRSVSITLLSTEYVLTKTYLDGGKTLNSIFADSVVKIGNDLYHLECQMQMNKELIIRMLEYDMSIGLVHGTSLQTEVDENQNIVSQKYRVNLPKSAILYLGTSSHISDQMECDLIMGNEESITYQVDVVKVQQYSLEDIEKKHLSILIPFLPIRYRRAIFSKNPKKQKQPEKN